MTAFPVIVEWCPDTGLYVGHVPGLPGVHTQAGNLDELLENIREVIQLLSENGKVEPETQFVGLLWLHDASE